jgi:hypothetical protein
MIRYVLPPALRVFAVRAAEARAAAVLAAVVPSLALLAAVIAPPALAALGGTEASVKADQRHLHATLSTAATSRYTVHELATPARSTVREYAAPSGVVFGVAWEGASYPDLRQLLGPYFQQYADALAKRRTRRSPVTVTLPGLVVQAGGHMRAFTGKAWLPRELPAGVVSGDIR